MPWSAQAPSNIALIKYMGKKDHKKNLPLNASLSYTLPHLQSHVSLEAHHGDKDEWQPFELTANKYTIDLPHTAQARFLAHLDYLKKAFHYHGHFIVRSCNNFPMGCGIASSASSFAALTRCATTALSELTGQPTPTIEEQAALSRLGSGSSCRSFFAPFALWEENIVSALNFPLSNLIHKVVLISNQTKTISSSHAHQLVKTSPHFSTRLERAKNNLNALIQALENKKWQDAYQVCWQEFWDMHRLFETATPHFTYMNEASYSVLQRLHEQWETTGNGPIVTMDAGPNIHLLYQASQQDIAERFIHDNLIGNYDVL